MKEHSEENILFLHACQKFKKLHVASTADVSLFSITLLMFPTIIYKLNIIHLFNLLLAGQLNIFLTIAVLISNFLISNTLLL